MTEELDILLCQRSTLQRFMREAETITEYQKASAELRQVNARIADVEAMLESARADADLRAATDPEEIARVLLEELPHLARTMPDLATNVRDELIRVLPLRGGLNAKADK